MKLTIYALVREKGVLLNKNFDFDVTYEELTKSQEDPHGYFEELIKTKMASLKEHEIVVVYSCYVVGGL